MLHKHYEIERWVKTLKEERDYLEEEFEKLPCTITVGTRIENNTLLAALRKYEG